MPAWPRSLGVKHTTGRRSLRAFGLSAGIVVVLASCGSDNSGTTSATTAPTTAAATTAAPAAGPATITIKSFHFGPNPLSAKVGDAITVTNDDGTNHTATADDKSFDTGRFSSGSRTITVTHAGAIAFHCDIHDYMTGVIQVSPA
jgi:plastocyanin